MFKCRGALEANSIFFSADGTVNVSMHYLLTKGERVHVLTQQFLLAMAVAAVDSEFNTLAQMVKCRSRSTSEAMQM